MPLLPRNSLGFWIAGDVGELIGEGGTFPLLALSAIPHLPFRGTLRLALAAVPSPLCSSSELQLLAYDGYPCTGLSRYALMQSSSSESASRVLVCLLSLV